MRQVRKRECVLLVHFHAVTSGGSWDLDNHTSVELPLLNPDKMQPVYSVEMVNNKIWVTTGSFISLLNAETLEREVRDYCTRPEMSILIGNEVC